MYVFLNEKSLPLVLWFALCRRKIVILDIESFSPGTRGLLEKLGRMLFHLGIAEDPDATLSAEEIRQSTSWWGSHPDMFMRLEPQIEEYYGFGKIDGTLSEAYAMACKHGLCKQADRAFRQVTRLRFFERRQCEPVHGIVGIPLDTLNWYRGYFGSDPADCRIDTVEPSLVLNTLTAMAIGFYILFKALRLTVFCSKAPQKGFLGADFIGDRKYIRLLGELAGPPERLLLVFRNIHQKFMPHDIQRRDGRSGEYVGHGQIPIRSLPAVLLEMLVDLARIYRLSVSLPNGAATEMMKLPRWRLVFRAFFIKRRFEYFFSRDDYNAEHIIRTDELRRVGTPSLGINHGLPVPEILNPIWRYVDFDTYYVFGDYLYRNYYAPKWGRTMTVRAVGSFGLPAKDLVRLDESRPEDIVIFISTMPGAAVLVDWASEIAKHFPDRTVYIKHKRSDEWTQGEESSVEKPPNVIETNENAFELLFKASYALSTPNSTITVEMLQFGLAAYVWDATEELCSSYYREFPNLCVKSAREFIERIDAIEGGACRYPREEYEGLAPDTRKPIVDVIREDLGLPENGGTVDLPSNDSSDTLPPTALSHRRGN